MTLRTERIRTLEQVRAFLDGNEAADFVLADRDSAYVLVRRTLERFGYHHRPGRSDKGLLRAYLAKVTGLSRAQLTRLIARHRRTGDIRDRRRKPPANAFQRRYTPRDVALLAEVDAAYGRLSGPATKEILRRQYEVHGDGRFERLARISNGHIHNLRARRDYRLGALSLDKTRPVQVSIGVRRGPDPQGRPGFVRVDTVHQGDLNGEKGLYALNVVDQVTQFEHIGAVVRITEHFLLSVLEDLPSAFPFRVEGFHADNGSEYINHRVARMLEKLHIPEFTKSRPRRSNDNALVESKNGAIVRGWLGRAHIPADHAPAVNDFLRDHLCPFLNFHRPCLFPSEVEGPRGRIKKRYRQQDIATPYESSSRSPMPRTSSVTASRSNSSTRPPRPPRASMPPRPSAWPAASCSETSPTPAPPPREEPDEEPLKSRRTPRPLRAVPPASTLLPDAKPAPRPHLGPRPPSGSSPYWKRRPPRTVGAGGDYFHGGPRRWTSMDNPEWQMLADWVRGQTPECVVGQADAAGGS
ncbi:integrase [Candidatus Palauibacter sp.]|uniref:integrase n=1 Tax=Candidatus Palauibacter sp. TaxID=3101350 RepID=UPI003B01B2F6